MGARAEKALFFIFIFEIGSHYVVQAGLELMVLLLQPSKYVLGLQKCTTVPG
jgi:hypothetical protein